MERQKLRVACKMETLAFLNGYHSAVGTMTIDQKASLLAKLHTDKLQMSSAKPPSRAVAAAAPPRAPSREAAPRAQPMDAPVYYHDEQQEQQQEQQQVEEDGVQWSCPEQPDEDEPSPSVHQRLQHVNDICNQAFDDPEAFDDFEM